jgi:hypothetical protein
LKKSVFEEFQSQDFSEIKTEDKKKSFKAYNFKQTVLKLVD